MNPVNDYAGPIIKDALKALVKPGFLELVYGGVAVGSYLCNYQYVDEIHITGSDKTFEAIVFGPDKEGARRKAERQPLLTKRVTCELGNITPVLIVPGPWKTAEVDYQAEKLVSWLVVNTGFICNTPHSIITYAQWRQREQFLDAVRQHLSRVPLHKAYYPGAHERHQAFVSAHPHAEQFGNPKGDEIPWTLIPAVAAENSDDICFTTEPFCGLIAETPINAASIPEFLDRAVDFANETLWGTLSAGLFVHPASLKDKEIGPAVERAVANLRYGTVSINATAGYVWSLPLAPWGGFAGQDIYNVQSGIGFVNNTLMFSQSQKTVMRAPFTEWPKTPSMVSREKAFRKLSLQLSAFEVSPSPMKLPGIFITVLQG